MTVRVEKDIGLKPE